MCLHIAQLPRGIVREICTVHPPIDAPVIPEESARHNITVDTRAPPIINALGEIVRDQLLKRILRIVRVECELCHIEERIAEPRILPVEDVGSLHPFHKEEVVRQRVNVTEHGILCQKR